jgi:serine/threonine-protein kinase
VYSLGTVLYEMLAGEPPFTGPTAQAVIAKRLSGEVPRVRHVRPSVPESVEQAVIRALAPVAADRFASVAEFGRALQPTTTAPTATTTRRPAADGRARRRMPVAAMALGLGILIGLGVLFAWRRGHLGGGAGGAKRVAVLPFENLGDTSTAYFADGIADEVRGKLAALPGLQVIARASSNQYKNTPKGPRQVGQELGVQYLLTGTVRWEKGIGTPGRVRVSPELVRAATASTEWQEPFDAPLTDVFRVQADIAGRVAQALGVALGAGERRELAERPTENLAAYDAFLRGEEASGGAATFDLAALQQAREHYQRAVALDPAFALAWGQLSRVHSLVYWNAPTPAGAAAARQSAERALALAPKRPEGHLALGALAPKRPEGHLALGDYYYYVRAEPAHALEQYAHGQQLAPKDARLLTAAAISEMWGLGRPEEALAHLRRAEVLDPRSVLTVQFVVYALVWLRRYPEAFAAAERGLTLAPGDLGMIHAKVTAHLARGDLAGARAALRAVPREVDPAALVVYIATYNDLYWALEDEQQRLLLRLSPEPFGGSRGNWALALAETHALRGNTGAARAYADSARLAFEAQLPATPAAPRGVTHAILGLTLAYAGRKEAAIREGERGVALDSSRSQAGTYIQHQLARTYILVGEPEKALDVLEPLLKRPYYLSPGWLRIDPNFAPLRGNPRFERLVNGT